MAGVARLLDAGEEEDALVGGEPEDDREEEEQLGRLEAALAREPQQSFEPALLENQHEQPEHRAKRERVHEELFDREDDRARHCEKDGKRQHGHDREREWQVRTEARLQVEVVAVVPVTSVSGRSRSSRTSSWVSWLSGELFEMTSIW